MGFQKPSAPSPTAKSSAIASPPRLQIDPRPLFHGRPPENPLAALWRGADQHQPCIRRSPPSGLGGQRQRPRQTRSAGPTDHASASAHTRRTPAPCAGTSPRATGPAPPGRAKGFLEVAGGNPAPVKGGQKRIHSPGPSRPRRPNRRSEATAILPGCSPIPDFHAQDHHRADPGVDGSFRAVPHQPLAPVGQLLFLHLGEKHLGFQCHRLRQPAARTTAQDLGQWIVGLVLSSFMAYRSLQEVLTGW